ncbi:tRNA wybutosine-synthesizing protein 4 isoform X2 [Nematostella vectensis]|uniref:tRNA wybutosine-synthesizing protein 4 isoform X2 n=1 Tax=Nematostella vectensis TaxID=45351 RepID=UPI0020772716|nr:tRNA wybutosine-synthesizing protein 4 isoform X2 [Nematostella vectensis]
MKTNYHQNLQGLEQKLLGCGIDTSCPTLLLSEVVLSYLDPISSSAVICWAAKRFDSAVFVSYEQVYPEDPFGVVMINHFNRLGSPLRSITSYPSPQAQVQRYIEKGWTKAQYQDMNSFFNNLPVEEKQRVEAIEPFDEFEEWHLKCSHYILICGLKGSCEAMAKQMLPQENNENKSSFSCSEMSHLHTVSDGDEIKRYGHCGVALSDDLVVVTGGFGLQNNRHTRISGMHVVCFSQGEWKCITSQATSGDNFGARMFHTMNLLSDNTILVYGGRTSPYKPCTQTILLSIERHVTSLDSDLMGQSHSNAAETSSKDCTLGTHTGISGASHTFSNEVTAVPSDYQNNVGCTYTARVVCCQGDSPSPRWRHSATTLITGNGDEGVLVIGGKTLQELALNDCYLLDIKHFNWTKISLSGSRLMCRHSHTATPWGSNGILLFGGLGTSGIPLSSLQLIDTQKFEVQDIDINPPLPPRYSHTAHLRSESLILIGGVSQETTGCPSATVLNLVSMTWKLLAFPVSPSSSPVMLHNHCSVDIGFDRIMVLGGGGNCFSFGTHLNQNALVLNAAFLTSQDKSTGEYNEQ